MRILELKQRPDIEVFEKTNKAYLQLERLLFEINKRNIPEGVMVSLNKEIEELNGLPDEDKALRRKIRKKQTKIIGGIEKELKLVTINHYRNTWMSLGIAAFGLPLGVAFGMSLGNIALMGVGLPLGIAVGLAVGSGMDKKAIEEGRQLNIELKN
jgi:hypothetical protein